MPLIKGHDGQKTHWLQASGYWGERNHAHNFTPVEATRWVKEIEQRNRYVPLEDRVIPEIYNVA